MTCIAPDATGHIERNGVRIHYDVYGQGKPTLLLLPTWSIVHSRCWKAQLPYLARHYRVITFDGRGNGKSDRPRGVDAHLPREYVEDAIAVLDATDTRSAIVVGTVFRRPSRRDACGALSRARRRRRADRAGRTVREKQPEPHAGTLHGAVADTPRDGRSTTSITGATTIRISRSSFSSACSASRTRPSRSRMRSAGRWKPTRQH